MQQKQGNKFHECCRQMSRMLPPNATKGAVLLLPPPHGTTTSMPWNYHLHPMELLIIRHLPPTFQPPVNHSPAAKSVKKSSSVAAHFPDFGRFLSRKA
ncbi:MAG: hypothetical protein IKR71_03435 [Bacteroidales bacterium]|nr:hypothetical protein [Bacteroidales bacterium]